MTGSIRVVIVDDEALARERLRRLLATESDVEIVGHCATGDAAVETILGERPDLVFLDVQMPTRDGFAVVDALLEALTSERMPLMVFVTAYDQHALRAFEAQALDYLVKPFEDERFAAVLARARRRVRQERLEGIGDRLRDLLSVVGPAGVSAAAQQGVAQEILVADPGGGRLEHLVLRSGKRSRIVRVEEVDWIGADGVYARIFVGRMSHLLRMAMHELEVRLDPRRFVRIHRSTIVNVDRVHEVHEEDRGQFAVVLQDGTRLKLSRSRRAQFEAVLGQSL